MQWWGWGRATSPTVSRKGRHHGRDHLDLGEVEVPAEAEAHHVDVFLAVAEGTRQRHVHWERDKRRFSSVQSLSRVQLFATP